MTLSVGYMGTKRQLAPIVSEIAKNCPAGPFLDLFSGICAVGSAVGTNRPVWCNDVQIFASNVASAFFTSQELPLPSVDAADIIYSDYSKNKAALTERWNTHINTEYECLKSDNISAVIKLSAFIHNVTNSSILEKERIELSEEKNKFPYRLFSITFANGYFGIKQCIQIDSIRYGIDSQFKKNRISKDCHRWLLLALAQATGKSSTTTGHFAQYIKPNQNNKRYFISQRKKSIWIEWLKAIDQLTPVGSRRWRANNKVFNSDASTLICDLKNNRKKPAIIYADPPYTDDQYSRYYHLYETLLLYDYPKTTGIGRYRPGRFRSNFSLKTEVSNAFDLLLEGCSRLESDFILSYPGNGLLGNDAGNTILVRLKKYFNKAEITHMIDHKHSTMGASKGKGKSDVTEIIFWARK